MKVRQKCCVAHLATEGVSCRAARMGLRSSSPVVVRHPASSNTRLSDAAASARGYFDSPADDDMAACLSHKSFYASIHVKGLLSPK